MNPRSQGLTLLGCARARCVMLRRLPWPAQVAVAPTEAPTDRRGARPGRAYSRPPLRPSHPRPRSNPAPTLAPTDTPAPNRGNATAAPVVVADDDQLRQVPHRRETLQNSPWRRPPRRSSPKGKGEGAMCLRWRHGRRSWLIADKFVESDPHAKPRPASSATAGRRRRRHGERPTRA